MYLENINGPVDLKTLDDSQLEALATEMRTALLGKLSKHGGHFGPNFGMVEATIALHYVFNSPVDKFVFDVSHQSYCHKNAYRQKKTLSCMKSITTMCQATPILMKASMTSLQWVILQHQ